MRISPTAPSLSRAWRALWLVPAAAWAIGCNRADAVQRAEPPAAAAGAPSGSAGGEGSDGSAQAQAGVVAADRYPGLLFELLDPAERGRFVGLAEAELCPCEGTVASLDACLQGANVCELGLQVGALMMRMVKEGAPDGEISDAGQQYVTNARRVWEFDMAGVPCVGASEPRVVLVNFSDFQCPHCREFAGVLGQTVAENPDVRLCFKQFPLGTHPHSVQAAVAALAADRQGQFHAFHDLVFERQPQLNAAADASEVLAAVAREVGLNVDRFAADLADPAVAALVDRDRREGMTAGIMATPTLYLNGVQLLDGYDLAALSARIAAVPAPPR